MIRCSSANPQSPTRSSIGSSTTPTASTSRANPSASATSRRRSTAETTSEGARPGGRVQGRLRRRRRQNRRGGRRHAKWRSLPPRPTAFASQPGLAYARIGLASGQPLTLRRRAQQPRHQSRVRQRSGVKPPSNVARTPVKYARIRSNVLNAPSGSSESFSQDIQNA